MIEAYPPIEARVLVEMIVNPQALALCDSLECPDLVDMRHVVVLWAIRQVQLWQADMNITSVLDAIEHIAIDRCIPEIAHKVDGHFLSELMRTAPKPDDLDTIRRDVVKLRKARQFREALRERRI